MLVRAFGAGIVALLLWSSVSAATLTSFVTKEGKAVIALKGVISQGDAARFKELTKIANARGRLVSGIRLNSPGGSLLEGAKLADLVRYAKIATVVANNAQCASACFLVFAAGHEKYANYTALIGVHGASDMNGKETVQAGAATVSMARILKVLGVPPDIIGKMVTTPPEKIVWLSPNELRGMGTTMVGKPIQVRPSEIAKPNLPMQLAPEIQANRAPTWDEFVRKAAAISSEQNHGKPRFVRTCQPELKVCITGIYIKGRGGKDMLLKTTEDTSGRTISREFCKFNTFGDIRSCMNWDTSMMHEDMKDANGHWIQVSK